MKILSRAEWDQEWKPIDPNLPENRALGLMGYAAKVNAHKQSWQIPPACSGNSRYEVYLETLLRSGVDVPDNLISQADPDANRFRDVPLIGSRIAALPAMPSTAEPSSERVCSPQRETASL